jgi:hypothetical protein
MSSISINHVSIHAQSLERSAAFYRVRADLIPLSATVHQTGDALRATLYLDGRDRAAARIWP